MAKFLTELITDDTHILELYPDFDVTDEEKNNILDIKSSVSDKYINYMYRYNNDWYYFKEDNSNYIYPFYIADELMGTYLAKQRNLKTISYEIAKAKYMYGLASINFKRPGFKYYMLTDLIPDVSPSNGYVNIEILRKHTINSTNEQQFMKSLFNLLSLDIHMIQRDRCELNFQFQIDEKTGWFDLAPLYDYSNCSYDSIGKSVINKIIGLDAIEIHIILKKYPEFRECLELCLYQSMKNIWDQICVDYHLNQECLSYEKIKSYYEVKDENQKQYIKTLLINAKKL